MIPVRMPIPTVSSTQAEYDEGGRIKAVNTVTHRFVLIDMENGLRIDVTNNVQALVAQCTLANPGGNTNSLEIAGGRFGATRYFGFAWDPATQSMAFRQGAASDSDRIVDTMTVYTNEYDTLTIDRRVTDANGTLLRFTTTEYTVIGGVRLPIKEVVHSGIDYPWGGGWVYYTEMSYYDNPSHLGSYRKLASRTSYDGDWDQYEYSYASCCNSLTNIAYSDDTPDVAFQYDRLGRLTSAVTSGISTNLFEYDGLELAAETQNGISITRATDSLGRPTGFTLGPDYEVGYGYDAYGRFHSVSSSVASATSMANYAYLAGSDLLASMTNSSGFFWSRTYEQQRNLIASVENRFNANPISRFDYANDSLARRTRRVDNLTVTNDFGYNLRSEVIGALMGTNQYGYAYDPIGNRLTATNNAEGWVYQSNPLNQYTNIADGVIVTPEYDLDGNMTATGDGWRYVWNGENRMILASNSQYIVTYAYDHQGRMVAKTVDGSSRQYLWDGYNIVADARAAFTNWFVWGLDLSGSLPGAGGVGGLLAEFKDGVPYLAAYDANGNVTEYISTNGVTAAHYEYSPFGKIVVQSGDLADAFTHRFSTKPWCGVTGLSEYLFRKYEPGMGRWRSRDSIGERGGVNLCGFVGNSPLSKIDPLGFASQITGDVKASWYELDWWVGDALLGALDAIFVPPGLQGNMIKGFRASEPHGLGKGIRDHWGIESRNHWRRDACAFEDKTRSK